MEILFKKQIDFENYIDIDEEILIEEINEQPIKIRWNYIAKMLNKINMTELNELTAEQKDLVCKYLQRQLERFAYSKNL